MADDVYRTCYGSILRAACAFNRFYRAMHLSAYARSWDRMSSVRRSVCPSVRPSLTLVICDHIGWKSRKLIARTISPTPSLLAAERRSTYSQENMETFGGDLRWGREKVACWRTRKLCYRKDDRTMRPTVHMGALKIFGTP